MVQVVFWAVVEPVMVEVHPGLCASIMLGACLQCHFGNEGSHMFDFHKPLPGAFRSQPAPCYGWETQQSTSALLGHWCTVS
jgi:hypothetical protein